MRKYDTRVRGLIRQACWQLMNEWPEDEQLSK